VVDTLTHADAADRDEVRALLVLDQAAGVGLVAMKGLVAGFGSAVEALRASSDAIREVARGFERPRPEAWRHADAALDMAGRLGIEVLTWVDPGYPRCLLNLHDPPPLLFLRGRTALLERPSITIVGARRATARSRDVAERLGGALAAADVPVASGLALGIDGAAHRGALSVGGDTVAVLGRGPDEAYPPSHRRLFREILERGLVVSEFPPGTPPLPHHFPRRNRILAALSRAVVVVESGARSGALITVDHALDLGIEVWSVPGPIDLAACEGSNRLLADGARPLLSIASFVSEVGGDARSRPALPEGRAGDVLSALAEEPLDVDQLSARLGLGAPQVLAALTELELLGLTRRLPGMRFGVAA
jgi:DNA processing protein